MRDRPQSHDLGNREVLAEGSVKKTEQQKRRHADTTSLMLKSHEPGVSLQNQRYFLGAGSAGKIISGPKCSKNHEDSEMQSIQIESLNI